MVDSSAGKTDVVLIVRRDSLCEALCNQLVEKGLLCSAVEDGDQALSLARREDGADGWTCDVLVVDEAALSDGVSLVAAGEGFCDAALVVLADGSSGDTTPDLPAEVFDYTVNTRDVARLVRRVAHAAKYVRMRRELGQGRERLRMLLGALADGIWESDLNRGEGRYTEHHGPLLGYGEGEFPPGPEGWLSLVHPDDLPRVREGQGRLLSGQDDHLDIEFRIRAQSGQWRWVLDRGRVVAWNRDGSPARLMGAIMDITERKDVEVQLRESRAVFSAFMENLPITAFIKDEGLHFIYANPCMSENFPVERWLSKTAVEYHPEALGAKLLEDDRRALAQGPIVVDEWVPNRAGQNRFQRTYKFPIDRDAGATWLGGVSMDMTESQEISEALRRSEERFRAVVDNSPDVIKRFDPALRHVYANPAAARLTGIPQEQFVGKTFRELGYDPSLCDFLEDKLHDVFATHKPVHTRFDFDGPEGHYTFDWRVVPEFGADGRVQTALSTARDISGLVQAEQLRHDLEAQMQQAQKLESLGVLAGGIAHDFNNLLTGILGNVDLALNALSKDHPAVEYVQNVEESAHRAAGLSQQMLAYSGRGGFMVQPLRFADVIRDSAPLLEAAADHRVTLHYDLDEQARPVQADYDQIRQILVNLVTNASESMQGNLGEVVVKNGEMQADRLYLASTYIDDQLPEGRYGYIEVRDSGTGMDEETLARVFDPFFTTKFVGRGLGLAATLGIVRGHKGAITVQSEPGKGTTVRALFPVCSQEKPDSQTPKPRRDCPGNTNGQPAVALVVDDETSVRNVGRKMLERSGFEVLEAANGAEALEVFSAHHDRVGLVILDLTMPEMDGSEAFCVLREQARALPVILASGFSCEEAAQRFPSNDENLAFIQKPFRMAELRRAIETLLNG